MFNAITIAFGLLVLWLANVTGVVINGGVAAPDVIVIAVVYAALHRDGFGALLSALVLGLVAGLTLGGSRGVYLLSLLPVVGMTLWARGRFPLNGTLSAAGWTVPASLVADATFAAIAAVLTPDTRVAETLWRIAPGAALWTGLVAIPYVALLSRIEPLLQERQERGSLFT